MRRFFNIFAVLIGASILFSGCNNFLATGTAADKAYAGGTMVTLTINAESGTSGARTALPDAINLNDYTYTLSYTNSSGTAEAFSGKAYDELGSASLTLAIDTYTFTLDAYSDSTKVLSGTVKNLDLSTGSVSSLSFRMFTVAGNTADTSVTLHLPVYNDLNGTTQTLVKSVKIGVSASPVTADGACEIVGSSAAAINSTDATDPKVTFTSNALTTGGTKFVIFYLYDADGNSIGTIAEAVVLVYGKTSSSEITADSYVLNTYPVEIRLQKNGAAWADARKVKLQKKSDSAVEVQLTKYGEGTDAKPYYYMGNAANSMWYVCVQGTDSNLYRNTYITLDTAQENIRTLNYYTVTLDPGIGVNLVYDTSKYTPQADGSILFLKGDSFTYKATIKDGYDTSSSITIGENETAVSTSLDTNLEVTVDKEITISTNSATAIPYTITYSVSTVNNQTPKWVSSGLAATTASNAPSAFTTYTVTNDFALPTSADITCGGQLIDGWYKSGETESSAFSTIKADTLHENLTLLPKWKEAEATEGEKTEEDSEGTLSSNGISFIIKDGGTDSNGDVITNIYFDIDSDGEIDAADGDKLVTINGNSNFTDYEITASVLTGGATIASDVTFTMTGGQIYSIKGLGKDAANKSILNISGTAKIGKATTTVVNVNNVDTTYATSCSGVLLNTFTDEVINVTGTVSSVQGSVIVLSDYNYDAATPHYIAKLANADSAEAGLFACFNTTKASNGYYPKKNLGKVEVSGTNYIRITNDEGISIETQDEGIQLVKDSDSIVIGFTVGEDRINTQCSVFSISTTNGTFKLNQVKIYPSDAAKEEGIQYLGQYVSSTASDGTKSYAYADDGLDNEKSYVYMHIMASNNQFTEGDASDFLKNVMFLPDKDGSTFKTMDVKINLETVPWDTIADMKAQAKTNVGKEEGFSYFDGSFYLGVKDSSKPKWTTCYNAAKQTTFNGLKGYLMNITSELENGYISNRVNVGNCWIGGARLDPDDSTYDDTFTAWDQDSIDTLDSQTYVTKYYWVSGPEAGTWFTDGNIPSGYTGRGVYGYSGCTKKTSWGSTTYTGTGTRTVSTNGYTNWDDGEPNDSCSGKSEQCVHFYSSTGKWNDYADSYQDPVVYIIEYTPYTRYNADGTVASTSGTPDAAPIKKTASFNLNSYITN